jgi:hypothetical protein
MELTSSHIDHIKQTNLELQRNKQILQQKVEQADAMAGRDNKMSDVIDIMIKNEETLKFIAQNVTSLNEDSIKQLEKDFRQRVQQKQKKLLRLEQLLEHAYSFDKYLCDNE